MEKKAYGFPKGFYWELEGAAAYPTRAEGPLQWHHCCRLILALSACLSLSWVSVHLCMLSRESSLDSLVLEEGLNQTATKIVNYPQHTVPQLQIASYPFDLIKLHLATTTELADSH